MSDASDTTSLTLLGLARDRDADAWSRLVKTYGPLVYRWCRCRGFQAADAADIGQEVFASVARGLGRFKKAGPTDSFRGWLYRITDNKIKTRQSRQAPVAEGGVDRDDYWAQVPDPVGADGQDSSVWTDRRCLVRKVIEGVKGEFSKRTWDAFWRTVVESQSPEDVAVALATTRNAVYLSQGRVRHRLRAALTPIIDPEDRRLLESLTGPRPEG